MPPLSTALRSGAILGAGHGDSLVQADIVECLTCLDTLQDPSKDAVVGSGSRQHCRGRARRSLAGSCQVTPGIPLPHTSRARTDSPWRLHELRVPSAKASEASPNAATTNSVSAPTSSTIGGAHVAPQRLLLFANARNLILVTGTMVFVCVLGAVAEGSESPDAAMAPVPTTMPDDLDSGTDRLVLRSAPMHCPCGTWRRVGSQLSAARFSLDRPPNRTRRAILGQSVRARCIERVAIRTTREPISREQPCNSVCASRR